MARFFNLKNSPYEWGSDISLQDHRNHYIQPNHHRIPKNVWEKCNSLSLHKLSAHIGLFLVLRDLEHEGDV